MTGPNTTNLFALFLLDRVRHSLPQCLRVLTHAESPMDEDITPGNDDGAVKRMFDSIIFEKLTDLVCCFRWRELLSMSRKLQLNLPEWLKAIPEETRKSWWYKGSDRVDIKSSFAAHFSKYLSCKILA